MVKNCFSLVVILIVFASCSSIKSLNFTSNKQINADKATSVTDETAGSSQVRFISDITVTPEPTRTAPLGLKKSEKKETVKTRSIGDISNEKSGTGSIEMASPLQLKYSVLLDTEVEQLNNHSLLEQMDEWYGTRYRLGGTTRKGVDCSAFVQAVFLGAYAVNLPRTAREQYKVARRISRTELQEGDLLFFNTTGGVSHVGIYLQNNKFIHASVSQGVTISDLFDPYYLRRFIGAGRVEDKQVDIAGTR